MQRRVFPLVLGILLFWVMGVPAAEDYEAACAKECAFLTKACTAYLECSVAKVNCQSSCMQRKVWEKVVVSLDNLSAVLEKQAQENQEKERTSQPNSIMPPAPPQAENTTESNPAAVSDSGRAKQ